MLSTTHQFAGAIGVAVLGALFLQRARPAPRRGNYIAAAELTAWLQLALIAATTVLVALLPRVTRAPAPAAAEQVTDAAGPLQGRV